MAETVKEDSSCYASEAQQEVLGMISHVNAIHDHFFITGGTALSVFYLYHRTSEDLDLFSKNFKELDRIDSELKRLFSGDLTLIQSSANFYSYLIKNVKVDIVFDPLSIKGDRNFAILSRGKDFSIDTLENIASNKLAAMASRTEPKDIIDFYFITDIIWEGLDKTRFLDCYKSAKKKEALLDDPSMSAYQIETLMKTVLTEREKVLPFMKKEVNWPLFEDYMKYYIDVIYRLMSWK
jgi:predicted nucleotidyltransferase component of viral defense system